MDVLVLMGSSSDFSVMQHAVPFFKQFDITARITVASAHRTPDRVHEEVRAAEEAGAVAIICAAGMAAHLAGVVADDEPPCDRCCAGERRARWARRVALDRPDAGGYPRGDGRCG